MHGDRGRAKGSREEEYENEDGDRTETRARGEKARARSEKGWNRVEVRALVAQCVGAEENGFGLMVSILSSAYRESIVTDLRRMYFQVPVQSPRRQQYNTRQFLQLRKCNVSSLVPRSSLQIDSVCVLNLYNYIRRLQTVSTMNSLGARQS